LKAFGKIINHYQYLIFIDIFDPYGPEMHTKEWSNINVIKLRNGYRKIAVWHGSQCH